MVLKRKRSKSELEPMFSSTEQLNSSSSFNFNGTSAIDTARQAFFVPRLSTPSHLPSRTMKRFRDNRPSESEVHRRTLDVLYSAQRRLPEPQDVTPAFTSIAEESASTQAPVSHGAQQRSLHSFWNIPDPAASTSSLASSPAASTMSPPSPTYAAQGSLGACEDCGARLVGDDGDVPMTGAGHDSEPFCGACRKMVCFSCSVSNLGENRRCLACVGSKV